MQTDHNQYFEGAVHTIRIWADFDEGGTEKVKRFAVQFTRRSGNNEEPFALIYRNPDGRPSLACYPGCAISRPTMTNYVLPALYIFEEHEKAAPPYGETFVFCSEGDDGCPSCHGLKTIREINEAKVAQKADPNKVAP
jgi:hypothetical protein